jgi:hypothetical protein
MAQPQSPPVTSATSGWAAWVLFGGILLFLLGVLHLTVGVLALVRPEILAGTRADLAFEIPLTAVAWIHLAAGAAAIAVGAGLVLGRRWARLVVVQLACLAAIVNFAFIAVYPIWSVVSVGLAILVSYAAARHGAEVADAYGSS